MSARIESSSCYRQTAAVLTLTDDSNPFNAGLFLSAEYNSGNSVRPPCLRQQGCRLAAWRALMQGPKLDA
jgi:hypothetical protein